MSIISIASIISRMSSFSKLLLTILVVSMLLTIVKMYKYRKSHFLISSIVGSLFFAFFFTLSSLFWTTDIAYDTETIQHLEFGWPVPFDIQNQDRFEPPFPYEMIYGHEVSGYFITENFYLSLLINFIGTLLIWMLVCFCLKIRNKNYSSKTKKLAENTSSGA